MGRRSSSNTSESHTCSASGSDSNGGRLLSTYCAPGSVLGPLHPPRAQPSLEVTLVYQLRRRRSLQGHAVHLRQSCAALAYDGWLWNVQKGQRNSPVLISLAKLQAPQLPLPQPCPGEGSAHIVW